jgi:hypothetical protein
MAGGNRIGEHCQGTKTLGTMISFSDAEMQEFLRVAREIHHDKRCALLDRVGALMTVRDMDFAAALKVAAAGLR